MFHKRSTVKPDLTTTCEQRPPVNNGQFESKSQFYQAPLSNGRFFQVPRVAVVHRFDCTQEYTGLWFMLQKGRNLKKYFKKFEFAEILPKYVLVPINIWNVLFNDFWDWLYGIMDNGINQLMGSNLSRLTNPKLPFPTYCMFSSFAYLYQLVIGITFSLSLNWSIDGSRPENGSWKILKGANPSVRKKIKITLFFAELKQNWYAKYFFCFITWP